MNSNSPPFQAGRYHLSTDFRIEHYIDMEIKDIEKHYHAFYECIFFSSGDIEYHVEDRCYYPAPGDVLLINIAQIHRPTMKSALPPYDRVSLLLSKGFLNELSSDEVDFAKLFESLDGCLIHLGNDDFWNVKALLSKLSNLSVNRQKYGSKILLRCYIIELLVCIGNVRSQLILDKCSTINFGSRIRHVKKHIEMNLEQPLSLDGIATEFHLSKYYLSHEFKKQTGMSLYAFVIKTRLTKACELLRNGINPVDITYACGFNDFNVLNRAFKKEFGMTPKKYVDSLQQSKELSSFP